MSVPVEKLLMGRTLKGTYFGGIHIRLCRKWVFIMHQQTFMWNLKLKAKVAFINVHKVHLLTFPKGWKSVKDVPGLVDDYMKGKLQLDEFITHNFQLAEINQAFDLLRMGKR